MSGKRKGISQREAVRNRRELRRLREFANRISGFASMDDTFGSWNLGEVVEGKMRGIDWALQGRHVFLARRNGKSVEIGVVRAPSPTGEDRT